MKKKIAAGVVAVIGMSAVSLSGCSFGADFKKAEQWRQKAEEMAVEYIEDKYDVDDVEVKSSKSDKSSNGSFSTNILPKTLVTLDVDGDKVHVYVDASKDEDENIADDYQKDEIIEALRQIAEANTEDEIQEFSVEYAQRGSMLRTQYMLHDKYEADEDASVEEKVEALKDVFNSKGDKGMYKSSSSVYPNIEIYMSFVTDDIDGLASETRYLSKDVYGFESMELYEIAFKSKSDLKKMDIEEYQSYNLHFNKYSVLMNGYTSFQKRDGYSGELKSSKYEFVEGDEFDYILVNCAPEDFKITRRDSEDTSVTKGSKKLEIISDTYKIEYPEGTQIVFLIDADEAKDVEIAMDCTWINVGGSKVDKLVSFGPQDVEVEGYKVYDYGLFGQIENVELFLARK